MLKNIRWITPRRKKILKCKSNWFYFFLSFHISFGQNGLDVFKQSDTLNTSRKIPYSVEAIAVGTGRFKPTLV
jgi:hypothetical protein